MVKRPGRRQPSADRRDGALSAARGRWKDERRVQTFLRPRYCALAAHIALEEAGAPYEAVLVDFRSQSQRSAEYLAVNPKGRVPALVTESGTLTETPALLCFVHNVFRRPNSPPR